MRINVNIDRPVSITELYDIIAQSAGIDPRTVEKFDCTKILVSEDLCDLVRKWYRINGGRNYKMMFSMAWIGYGPKVDKNLGQGEAEFTDDFMTIKEEK